jgi:hypothetical protein
MRDQLQWLLASALAVTTLGCGPYLRWEARPAMPMVAGKLAISVADNREPKKGGDDKRVIGYQPGPFAIPDPIRMPTETEVADTMHELLGQAALAAGIGVAPVGDPTPTGKLAVEVQTFWCAGFTFHFVVNIAASMMVIDPASGAVRVPGQPISVEDSAGDCRSAYRKALTKAFDMAAIAFAQPGMKQAAVGAPVQ